MAFREDRFTSGEGLIVSQCVYCTRRGETSGQICTAFPGGIPDEILTNDYDHREPWIDPATNKPGDVGLTGDDSLLFDPLETTPEDVLEGLYAVLDAAAPHVDAEDAEVTTPSG